jgi:hypothetical protein
MKMSSSIVARRPKLEICEISSSAVFNTNFMREDGVYEGRKTILQMPITEVSELGFDIDLDEYCVSLEDAALAELLSNAGVASTKTQQGVSIEIGEPRSRELMYRSLILQLKLRPSIINDVTEYTKLLVDESWPSTKLIGLASHGSNVMTSTPTPRLDGQWQNRENLVRNVASALFEVFQPGFASSLIGEQI